MIRFSKFNILSGIRDSENYFILNQLSGNADILSEAEANRINELKDNPENPEESEFLDDLISKGYFADAR